MTDPTPKPLALELADALEAGHCGLQASLLPAAAELRRQHQAIVELRKALSDAATSMETIARLAGRPTYGDPPIESYMGEFYEVRAYATGRASAARATLTKHQET